MKIKKILIFFSVSLITVLFLGAAAAGTNKYLLSNKKITGSGHNTATDGLTNQEIDNNSIPAQPAQPPPQEPAPKETEQIVKRVKDGDTIELESGQIVRYIGIDAPELNSSCVGNQPRDKNKELVEGKKVKLVRDTSEIDKYGRVLRYVYTNDGAFINDILLKEGLASLMLIAPDKQFKDQFEKSAQEAKAEKRGLWSDECAQAINEINPTAAPSGEPEDQETPENERDVETQTEPTEEPPL